MTEGFYKYADGELLYAPNYIEGNGYLLVIQDRESYEYPVDGWRWFDSEEHAKAFYNIES